MSEAPDEKIKRLREELKEAREKHNRNLLRVAMRHLRSCSKEQVEAFRRIFENERQFSEAVRDTFGPVLFAPDDVGMHGICEFKDGVCACGLIEADEEV